MIASLAGEEIADVVLRALAEMRLLSIKAPLAALPVAALALLTGPPFGANAQTQPVTIPLQYVTTGTAYRLGINVGINGGAPQIYMFDTGSNVFNAAFNPATWAGFGQTVPNATVANGTGVNYCYRAGVCFTGNLVQIPALNFYAAGAAAGAPVAASLAAAPGFQVNAVYQSTNPNQSFPSYFQTTNIPPVLGTFYGIFGAGNFATTVNTGAVVGGVLGQTIIPGLTQGYVVSANGQPNPASFNASGQPLGPVVNGPTGNQMVTLAGRVQPVSPCVACVTLGLTPQLIGQFAPVGAPGQTAGQPGVVPWARVGSANFPNPYGGATGNNSSIESGSNFTVTLTSPGGSSVTQTSLTLLDTGTPVFALSRTSTGGSTATGTGIAVSGATPGGGPIAGVPPSNATLTGSLPGYPDTFTASIGTGTTNTIGIGFFMQNSVMFDQSDRVIGYTPFYVTAADLATTANGPLIVGATNVPLGLAGVISGPGGVTINSGGAVQLSATNTYTGATTIAGSSGGVPAGQLYISGPGSIAASSGVMNNGLLDISRAWFPVSIQALTGGGQVNLGGQNLTLTNASGTFSGTIADGGAWPGAGGSLTIAGGSQTLAGINTYTGPTLVTGGALAVNGSIASNVTVGGGGMLGGSGLIAGSVINNGLIAPGYIGGALAIVGSYTQAPGSAYLAAVNASGQSNTLAVIGPAAIQGGAVIASAQPGPYGLRTTYTLLNATGGVSGTYSSVTGSLPFLLPSLRYDANDVYLTLQVGGFLAAAQTPTQQAVGAALDASVATATGDFATVLTALAQLNAAQVLPILTALSGQNYSGFSNSMVQGAQLFMNNFLAQAGGGSGGNNKVALAEACDVACDTTAPALWGAWGGALGGLGTVGQGLSTGTVTYNVGGFAAGLDRKLTDNVLAGVTVGYTAGQQWVGGFSGQGFSNTVQAGLYGGYRQGPVYLDGIAGYAYSANQLNRSIVISGLAPRTAIGQTGANQFYGQLEGGWRIDLGGAAEAFVTPFARGQAYTGTQNAFTESGAQSLNLSVAAQTTTSLRTVFGAQLGGAVDLGWRDKLNGLLRLGWGHEFADTARPVAATFAGAPTAPFTTYGASPQRDSAVIGIAANTAITQATSIYLRYEGDIAGQDSSHALTVGVRTTW
jgi:autotransporter-associated beta strand protein